MQRVRIVGIVLVVLSLTVLPALGQGDGELDPETQATVNEIEDKVVELRGLEPATDIDRILVLEDELATLVQEDLVENYPAEDVVNDALWYCTLGFMACDVDLFAITEAMLMEQVAGFYDTETNEMYVLSEGGELDALAMLLYSHEYTHALQDANFDLDSLLDADRLEAEPDYALATLALIEGDAQMMTFLYIEALLAENPLIAGELLLQMGNISDAEFQNAPQIMQDELLFPYDQGMIFVQSIYGENGWRLVDGIYERPPLSTEQILHPDLYLIYEEPQVVDLISLEEFFGDSTEWTLLDNHALGEFYIREHLALTQGDSLASQAAAGWGGDQFRLYANANGETIAAWKQTWDTDADMTEFAQTYANHAGAWLGAPADNVDDVITCWDGAVRGVCFAEVAGATYVTIAPMQVTAFDVLQFVLQAESEME